MSMPNKHTGEYPPESEPLAQTQPALRHAFRHVYGFILQAVRGNRTTADAIFEDYLAGKLSEELLSISRALRPRGSSRSSNREIEEGLGGVETIKSGRGAGVSDDALTAAPS
jgi:hypothetical protein